MPKDLISVDLSSGLECRILNGKVHGNAIVATSTKRLGVILLKSSVRENVWRPCTRGNMMRFKLGNKNPKMAAAAFCSALLLAPKTK